MKNIFKMDWSWRNLLIFTVLVSVFITVLNIIPALEGTSFQLPAVTMEFWILPALYIVLNCRSYKDAMLKILVFFLVGQPLIYLLEVPFKAEGWGLFKFYPFWFKMTLLTVPAAAVAYRIKKDDLLSAFILSLGGLFMFTQRVDTLVIARFPTYFIAFLFCLITPFVLVPICLKKKKTRIAGFAFTAVMLAVNLVLVSVLRQPSTMTLPAEPGVWTVDSVSDKNLSVSVMDEYIEFGSAVPGEYTVVMSNENGKVITYNVTVNAEPVSIDVDGPHSN